MSEYQYYEFRTDGRTLDEAARKELRQLSSRAIVTSTQAIYTYSGLVHRFGHSCLQSKFNLLHFTTGLAYHKQ